MRTAVRRRQGWWLAMLLLAVVALITGACTVGVSGTGTANGPDIASGSPTPDAGAPEQSNGYTYLTPLQLREVYNVEPLTQQGYTGKGQTVVLIESYGSPTLEEDLKIFDEQYDLPPVDLQVIAPLGTKQFDPNDEDMFGWAYETSEDVQIIHAIAPDASIVVLTSPVDETEGTVGLPEFRQLEQYALDHQLGTIISQSWGVSEVTLTDSAGQQEIARWNTFYQQATTQQHITFFSSSGDSGATDYTDASLDHLSPTPTTSFPTDNPWVTSVGGTVISYENNGMWGESAWSLSGGGFSRFYTTPSFQTTLPAAVQSRLSGRRGVPDVAATADPRVGPTIYVQGARAIANGTSAGSPLWAALTAIANQMAGHPLGYLTPTLYQLAATHAQDFRDITAGNNSVDARGVQVTGYPAVAGWDPITGWGTPNAANLLPDLVAAA